MMPSDITVSKWCVCGVWDSLCPGGVLCMLAWPPAASQPPNGPKAAGAAVHPPPLIDGVVTLTLQLLRQTSLNHLQVGRLGG